jgi:integrase
MAALRNRNGKWEARIRRKGQPTLSKSFQAKQDAERWSRGVEAEIDRGTYCNTVLAERILFKEIIGRFIQEVTLTTRSMKEDKYRLNAMARHWIGNLSMLQLTPIKAAEYRDERLKLVSAGTVIRELAYISSITNHARREWGINMVNPIPLVKKPPTPIGRNRILNQDELNRLLSACKPRVKNGNIWVYPLVQFALATAMRRGEMLGLQWKDINLHTKTAFIQMTKNGESRTVPLSTEAIKILGNLPRNIDGRVFPINGPNLSVIFEKALRIAKIENFHFHDLRHMAITRMAEKLPNLIELSAVSEHKSLAMLKRYYNPNPKLLAEKLG